MAEAQECNDLCNGSVHGSAQHCPAWRSRALRLQRLAQPCTPAARIREQEVPSLNPRRADHSSGDLTPSFLRFRFDCLMAVSAAPQDFAARLPQREAPDAPKHLDSSRTI